MNPLRLAAALAAALLLCLLRMTATTVIPPTLDDLVERSSSVVRVHVVATQCEWRGTGEERRIVTVVSLAVAEAIVGDPGSSMQLEFLGGELDGERMWVAGQPLFAAGQEDILFVSREQSTITPLVRMMYGRYLVAGTENGRRFMARANGAPLLAVDQIPAALGVAPSGEAMAMAVDAALTPDQFADAIRDCAIKLGRTDVSISRGGSEQ